MKPIKLSGMQPRRKTMTNSEVQNEIHLVVREAIHFLEDTSSHREEGEDSEDSKIYFLSLDEGHGDEIKDLSSIYEISLEVWDDEGSEKMNRIELQTSKPKNLPL